MNTNDIYVPEDFIENVNTGTLLTETSDIEFQKLTTRGHWIVTHSTPRDLKYDKHVSEMTSWKFSTQFQTITLFKSTSGDGETTPRTTRWSCMITNKEMAFPLIVAEEQLVSTLNISWKVYVLCTVIFVFAILWYVARQFQ